MRCDIGCTSETFDYAELVHLCVCVCVESLSESVLEDIKGNNIRQLFVFIAVVLSYCICVVLL